MTRANRCIDITLAIIHVNTYVELSTKNNTTRKYSKQEISQVCHFQKQNLN
jgi:hypothetical protein